MNTREFLYDGANVSWPSSPSKALSTIQCFEDLVGSSPSEQQLQDFLQQHPYLLAWLEPHCHHVIKQPRLGSQYIPDFLLPEMSSAGIQWVLVEIERSDAKLTTTSGQFGSTVRTAIQQIRDWQRWLEENRDYAIRPIPKGGLGLAELNLRPKGLVIVGRRQSVTERFNNLRADCMRESVEIITYDRVIDWGRDRAAHIGSAARSLGLTSDP